jgi:hypothetical protein
MKRLAQPRDLNLTAFRRRCRVKNSVPLCGTKKVLQSKHIISATGWPVRIMRHRSVIDRVPTPGGACTRSCGGRCGSRANACLGRAISPERKSKSPAGRPPMLRRKPRTHFAWQTRLTSQAIQIFPRYPPSCWMPGTRSVGTRALAGQIHKTAAASAATAESALTTNFRLGICFRTRILSHSSITGYAKATRSGPRPQLATPALHAQP